MQEFKQRLRGIINHPELSFKQKAHCLALEAENCLEYPKLDTQTQQALDERVICDMYEGHACYKPRYVLPDYAKALRQGCAYLELDPPKNLDEAINFLMILYHHTPSVTQLPVYIGQLDTLLLPYIENVSDETLYQTIKRFWIFLDRTLPDAFMHANIGPTDNRVARTILRIDADLKQIAPNLTFLYDPQQTPDELLHIACNNICECSKPHIANYPLHAACFDQAGFGIVSCYNALPLGGGSSTLVRLNLKEVAQRSSNIEQFFATTLPNYCDKMFDLMRARIDYLFNHSHFFDSFLVKEGLIDTDRFTAMYGAYGMAEAVNLLLAKESSAAQYGQDDEANQLSYRISAFLADKVQSTELKQCWRGHAMLHAQSGISTDSDVTPGMRIPYGDEPDPVSHIQALAPHHQYYSSGISDILTLDETVKANPQAVVQLCKGAFAAGFREFTCNVSSNDLVRITGYMVRLSDIEKFKQQQGSRTNTTALGAEAAEKTPVLKRSPRELSPVYDIE